MESQRFNLAEGDILSKLLFVSVPIIGTQLMLMGYNLVDMFLLGRVGSGAVAASGSAGMYMWLAGGLMLVGRMGAEIGVAQTKGRKDKEGALGYAHNALFLSTVLGIAFGAVCLAVPGKLIGFLAIREAEVADAAADYLWIIGLGVPATFLAAGISGVFTGAGNSRTPFVVNACGLLLNAVLDPLFIFTFGLGVRGAAIATVVAQLFAFFLSLYWLLRKKDRPFPDIALWRRPHKAYTRQILRWTVPVSLENLLFTFCTMIVARQIARYGADAITVYRVGSQAESICWLICLGFSSGITAFIGQNFGAGRWTRIWRGVKLALVALLTWGIIISVLFLLAGQWITGLFVPDARITAMGATYLWILAFCQVFFCMECIAAGAFRGLGRTGPPSIASITCNALRIPIVYFLASTDLGLNGVWWGISATATMRGLWVFLWFLHYARSRPAYDEQHPTSVRGEVSSDVPSVRILP